MFVCTSKESYARPIHTSRRSGSSVPMSTDALPTAFSTLSSIATDALYALEREESLRRAEYEAKHSEMLRRVEHATRHAEILQSFGRLSKSAATSPVATPYLSGRSATREYFDPEVEDDNDSTLRSHRCASGGWTHDILPPSYGTSRTVESEQRRRAPNTWTSRSQSNSYSNPPVFAPSDDSPSPRSTDEDLPTPAQMSAPARTTGAYITPSTSPFLGGLSTLNIHSTQPSRAPSPIMLPPPATRPGSPGDDFQRRRGGAPDSPPISFTAGRKRRSSGDYEPYRYALLILISIWPSLHSITLVSYQRSRISAHIFLSAQFPCERDPIYLTHQLLSVLPSWPHHTCPFKRSK